MINFIPPLLRISFKCPFYFVMLITNKSHLLPIALMAFYYPKIHSLVKFYCEMLHIEFLNHGSFSLRKLYCTYSFLLTHRPQSDKLLWCIPVWAGGDPHSPDTQGGLPFCRSNWNMRAMIFFFPPLAVESKGSHTILIKG